jgi:hypothetical protein
MHCTTWLKLPELDYRLREMNMFKIGNTRKASRVAVVTLFASTIASSVMAETQMEALRPAGGQDSRRGPPGPGGPNGQDGKQQ